MAHRLFITIFILILGAGIQAAQDAEAKPTKWPTTRFHVYNGFPGTFSLEDEHPEPSQAALADLEAFLTFSAEEFQKWGFPAPLLPLVTQPDGKQSYEMYMSDDLGITYMLSDEATYPNGTATGAAWTPRTGFNYIVLLNRNRALKQGSSSLKDAMYSTAAHELMHTIQHNTKYFDDYTQRWIRDGTADAVAIDLATRWLGKRELEGQRWPKRTGARTYAEPLAIEDDHESRWTFTDYGTQSFWRYLAEYFAVRNSAAVYPSHGYEPTDYSYLVTLFKRINHGQEPEEAYKWLREGVQAHGGAGADAGFIYGLFLATKTAYAANRYKDLLSFDANFRGNNLIPQWVRVLFGNCTDLAITSQIGSLQRSVQIPEMAAHCVWVTAQDGLNVSSFDFQVEGASLTDVQQLWMGTYGATSFNRSPTPVEDESRGRANAMWPSLKINGSERVLLILTNAATPIEKTQPVTVQIRATINSGSASRSTPTRQAPGASPEIGPNNRQEAANAEALAAASVSPDMGAMRAGMGVSDNTIDIGIGSGPSIADVASLSVGVGGIIDTSITSSLALNEAMGSLYQSEMEVMEFEENTPDSTISISFSRVPYGFTGTLDNARITSNDPGYKMLSALDPTDIDPSPLTRFLPNGQVHISEYSPTLLSGTYSATLVDPMLTEAQKRQSQPTLRTVRTITGHFTVSAPWLFQPDAVVAEPSDLWGDIERDIANRLPPEMRGIAPDVTEAAQQTVQSGDNSSTSVGASEQSTARTTCDCSCGGLDALDRIGEELELSGAEPTPDQMQVINCAMSCMSQYMQCE